jgi:hypothetical protein
MLISHQDHPNALSSHPKQLHFHKKRIKILPPHFLIYMHGNGKWEYGGPQALSLNNLWGGFLTMYVHTYFRLKERTMEWDVPAVRMCIRYVHNSMHVRAVCMCIRYVHNSMHVPAVCMWIRYVHYSMHVPAVCMWIRYVHNSIMYPQYACASDMYIIVCMYYMIHYVWTSCIGWC